MTLKYHPGPDEARGARRRAVRRIAHGRGVRWLAGTVLCVALVAAMVGLPVSGGSLGWREYLVALAVVGAFALALGIAARRHLSRRAGRGGGRCRLCGERLGGEGAPRAGGCPECGS